MSKVPGSSAAGVASSINATVCQNDAEIQRDGTLKICQMRYFYR